MATVITACTAVAVTTTVGIGGVATGVIAIDVDWAGSDGRRDLNALRVSARVSRIIILREN